MAQVRRLGPKVGGHLALFCIHCVNRVCGTLVVTSWICYSALYVVLSLLLLSLLLLLLCYYAGCWDNPDNKDCLPEPGCVARSPLNHPNIRNNTRFCCCRGHLCNVNVTDNVNFTALEILARQQSALDAAQHIG